MEQLVTVCAAVASSDRPTSVEPVKDSLRTRGSASIAATSGPALTVVSTFTTPSGTAASRRISATANADSGVSLAGFSTTVQPAASAGPILRVAMAAGKFHGVTRTLTPTGWCCTMIRLAPEGAVTSAPSFRTASSAYQRKNSAA